MLLKLTIGSNSVWANKKQLAWKEDSSGIKSTKIFDQTMEIPDGEYRNADLTGVESCEYAITFNPVDVIPKDFRGIIQFQVTAQFESVIAGDGSNTFRIESPFPNYNSNQTYTTFPFCEFYLNPSVSITHTTMDGHLTLIDKTQQIPATTVLESHWLSPWYQSYKPSEISTYHAYFSPHLLEWPIVQFTGYSYTVEIYAISLF